MPERDDLKVDVPYFGSAHQDEVKEQVNTQTPQIVTVTKSSSHWVHTLLILILIGAVGAIGYWGYDFKQDQEQRMLLAEATESRIAELEQLLADSQAQAKKSGQTLQQRLDAQFKLVEEQKELMDTQYTQYEENFAKLIENASVKQAQQLDVFNKEIVKLELKIKNTQEDAQEEMGFMTSQQKTALSGLEDRLTEMDGLRTALTNLEINQTTADSVQKGIVADFAIINKDLTALTTKLDAEVAGLKSQTQAVDSSLEQYNAAARKSIKALTSKVSVIARKAAPKLSSSVTKRLKSTESAIAAIDGSRAQVNKEIQRLKSKVNKIQLQLQ